MFGKSYNELYVNELYVHSSSITFVEWWENGSFLAYMEGSDKVTQLIIYNAKSFSLTNEHMSCVSNMNGMTRKITKEIFDLHPYVQVRCWNLGLVWLDH